MAIGAVGKKLSEVAPALDEAHRLRTLAGEPLPRVEGSNTRGEVVAYQVDLFDFDGDGKADAVLLTGGRVHDAYRRPVEEPAHQELLLFNPQGLREARYRTDERGIVVLADAIQWKDDAAGPKGLYREESVVIGRIARGEATAVPLAPKPFIGSGLKVAMDSLYQDLGQTHLGAGVQISDFAGGADLAGDGLGAEDIKHAGLRTGLLPGDADYEQAKAAAAERIARGDLP